MPPKCTGRVETKVNPFFKIAKSLMDKMKSKGGGENAEGLNDRGKPNSDFQTSDCKSRAFNPVEGTSEFTDYQEIKL